MLKVHDLTITNVDLLANSSNHKAVFPEYLKNIPRIYVSKIFQRYPRNIARSRKYFCEVMKLKYFFVSDRVKMLILAVSCCNAFLNLIETVFHRE